MQKARAATRVNRARPMLGGLLLEAANACARGRWKGISASSLPASERTRSYPERRRGTAVRNGCGDVAKECLAKGEYEDRVKRRPKFVVGWSLDIQKNGKHLPAV